MPDTDQTLATKKQYRTLAAIHDYAHQHGTAPTLDELAHLLGLARASSAHFRVHTLVRLGWVTTGHTPADPHAEQSNAPTTFHTTSTPARTLRLTPDGETYFARLHRLYTSTLLCGERDLLLDPAQFQLAQKLSLPLATVTVRTRHNRHILRFTTAAERNLWADQLLQHLPATLPQLE